MNTHELIDELIKMGISIFLGGLLGLEREYQNKPAGFRTLALICIGATAFTILSIRLAGDSISHDRIAANIITGIGFIGAGVIFKSGVTVYGLTTAATIWVTAGIGMAVGAGVHQYGREPGTTAHQGTDVAIPVLWRHWHHCQLRGGRGVAAHRRRESLDR